jgi:hypothetical protein
MRYYNDTNGKYEDLILTDKDLSVKVIVEQMYAEKPTLFYADLSNRVQDYYYDVVGISNNRLWAVIDYYCEMLITEKFNEWYMKGSKSLDNMRKEVI